MSICQFSLFLQDQIAPNKQDFIDFVAQIPSFQDLPSQNKFLSIYYLHHSLLGLDPQNFSWLSLNFPTAKPKDL